MTLRVPKTTFPDRLLRLVGLKRDLKVPEGASEGLEFFGPSADVKLEKESVAETINKSYPSAKLNLWYLGAVYGFFLLVLASQYWGGNLLFPLLAFFFFYVIGKRLVKIEFMIKEVRVSAVMDESSEWHERILSWQTFLKIGCWVAALFISLSFFLFFYTTGVFYKLVILLDALVIIWLTQKLKSPFTKHLKEKASNLIGELAANFLNVCLLFITFVAYSLAFDNPLSGFEAGTIDANIPIWVKENIHHS